MKNTKFSIIFLVLAVALISIVVVLAVTSPDLFKKPYSMVSANGTLYVGRLSNVPFSNFVFLKDVYVVSDVRNEEGAVVDQQLVPLKNNPIWAPEKFYINKDAILFKGLVGKCSSIDRGLRPDNTCPAPQPAGNGNVQAPTGDAMMEGKGDAMKK